MDTLHKITQMVLFKENMFAMNVHLCVVPDLNAYTVYTVVQTLIAHSSFDV